MGAKFQVTAPAGKITAKVVGVNFADGVAVVDAEKDRRALAYFKRSGYKVETIGEPEPAAVEEQPGGRPKASANKPEWVAYAVAQGMDPADAEKATKEQLIAAFPEGAGQ